MFTSTHAVSENFSEASQLRTIAPEYERDLHAWNKSSDSCQVPRAADETAASSNGPFKRRTNVVDATPPLDFEQLVRRCLGKIELAEKLFASFKNRFPVELSQIERCLLSGNATHLERLIVQLKGAAANVSAVVLHALLTKMAHAARTDRLDDVNVYLADVRQAWGQFMKCDAATSRNGAT